MHFQSILVALTFITSSVTAEPESATVEKRNLFAVAGGVVATGAVAGVIAGTIVHHRRVENLKKQRLQEQIYPAGPIVKRGFKSIIGGLAVGGVSGGLIAASIVNHQDRNAARMRADLATVPTSLAKRNLPHLIGGVAAGAATGGIIASAIVHHRNNVRERKEETRRRQEYIATAPVGQIEKRSVWQAVGALAVGGVTGGLVTGAIVHHHNEKADKARVGLQNVQNQNGQNYRLDGSSPIQTFEKRSVWPAVGGLAVGGVAGGLVGAEIVEHHHEKERREKLRQTQEEEALLQNQQFRNGLLFKRGTTSTVISAAVGAVAGVAGVQLLTRKHDKRGLSMRRGGMKLNKRGIVTNTLVGVGVIGGVDALVMNEKNYVLSQRLAEGHSIQKRDVLEGLLAGTVAGGGVAFAVHEHQQHKILKGHEALK